MNLQKLIQLNELAKENGKQYKKKRIIYNQIISEKGKHFIGIVGARGIGKTVLLKQMTLEIKNSFYISLDTLGDEYLFDVVKILIEKYKIKLFLLDEIHFQKEYEKQLKTIFDFFNIRIIFTSSVSLSLFESSYDLSRRVKLIHLHPFTIKEYLFFINNVSLPALSIPDIIKKQWSHKHLYYEYIFEEYLKGGLFPFSLEEPDVLPILKNILHKIIQKDIPMVAKLHINELPLIEKILEFIGKSPVDGINYTSIAKNIGITKYKAEQYISLLQKAFVLNQIFPAGTNVLKEPKILMHLPFRLLYSDYKDSIGAIREDFFVQMLIIKRCTFYYLKSKRGEKTLDYLVKHKTEDIVIEIGGKSKGREQFKDIKIEKKLILCHPQIIKDKKRPLFLLGFI